MANIHSQEKRILRAERERNENRRYTSAIKTYFRRLEAAVAGGDDEQADAEHRRLVQLIDKAVKRGALHRNTGARKKDRAARLRRGAVAPAPRAPGHDDPPPTRSSATRRARSARGADHRADRRGVLAQDAAAPAAALQLEVGHQRERAAERL